eukprot:40083-Chlamydomonas_euryale.AAC.1
MVMIQPQLTAFSFSAPPEPVLLDVQVRPRKCAHGRGGWTTSPPSSLQPPYNLPATSLQPPYNLPTHPLAVQPPPSAPLPRTIPCPFPCPNPHPLAS